jgi:signal transduction histidine kinase
LVYQELNSLAIKVVDNGKGISGARIEKNVGLRSIQERAASFKGDMSIVPRSPSGMSLVVTLRIGVD